MVRKVISLMASQKKKDALHSQIRNMKILGSMRDLSPADSMQKMHRVIAEFVVPRLEMFSQSVVRHRQSESRFRAVS